MNFSHDQYQVLCLQFIKNTDNYLYTLKKNNRYFTLLQRRQHVSKFFKFIYYFPSRSIYTLTDRVKDRHNLSVTKIANLGKILTCWFVQDKKDGNRISYLVLILLQDCITTYILMHKSHCTHTFFKTLDSLIK